MIMARRGTMTKSVWSLKSAQKVEQREGRVPTPLADMDDTRAIGLGTMAEMMRG